MKRIILGITTGIIIVLIVVFAASQYYGSREPLTGVWVGEYKYSSSLKAPTWSDKLGGQVEFSLVQTGNKVTGNFAFVESAREGKIDGIVLNNEFTFDGIPDRKGDYAIKGRAKLAGNVLDGIVSHFFGYYAFSVSTNRSATAKLGTQKIAKPAKSNFQTNQTEREGMVLIPAGEFSMGDHHDVGDSTEKPVHTVFLDAYYIDKYEVTNAQYATFLNEYGKNEDAAGHKLLDTSSCWCLIERVGPPVGGTYQLKRLPLLRGAVRGIYQRQFGYENLPVSDVSWYGAAAYAQFYGKRLPTEAQWEKAARGGLVGNRYPWGNNITHDDANYMGTGGRDIWWRPSVKVPVTSPVGSFPPNGYGLYDVAGNVWEWCADEYSSIYYSESPGENPLGPGTPIFFMNDDFTNVTSSRVLRGGSWREPAFLLRCTFRNYVAPARPNTRVGFRCVQDL